MESKYGSENGLTLDLLGYLSGMEIGVSWSSLDVLLYCSEFNTLLCLLFKILFHV